MECVGRLRPHSGRVLNIVSMAPAANIVVSTSDDRTVKVCDLEKMQCIATVSTDTDGVRALACLRGRIYLGTKKGSISVFGDHTPRVTPAHLAGRPPRETPSTSVPASKEKPVTNKK